MVDFSSLTLSFWIYYDILHEFTLYNYIYIEVVRADPTGPRQDPAYLRSESYAPQRYKGQEGFRVLVPTFDTHVFVPMGYYVLCLTMGYYGISMM